MSFGGFNKNSGPATRPGAPIPAFGAPTSSSDFPRTVSPPLTRVDTTTPPSSTDYGAHIYRRSPETRPHTPSSNLRAANPANIAEVPYTGRTRPRFPESPNEVSRSSRIFVQSQADRHYGNENFSVPYRARSPPLAFQNNPYAVSQQPISDGQQHPFSSPVWGNQPKSYNFKTPPAPQGISSETTVGGGAYSQGGPNISGRRADVPAHKRTRSPTLISNNGASLENTDSSDGRKRSLVDYRDLDAPEATPSRRLAFEQSPTGRAYPSSPIWHHSQPSTSYGSPSFQDDAPFNLASGVIHQPERALEAKHPDGPFLKRTRSPQSDEVFSQQPDTCKRALDPRSHERSSISEQTRITEAVDDKPMHVHTVKKTKLPLVSSSSSLEENLDSAQEAERELNAKAQRLARFKEELSQPVNPSLQTKLQHQTTTEKQRYSENAMADSDGSVRPDNEGVSLSSSIIGLCSDMCPESERAERGRKGDLDQYERLDGDRNQSSEFLAVKKYTRTAEREAELIRPMPVLQRTMEYLLNLLDQPYDDRFLGLYNFLWDRMRAIRMDLRMQHIFNLDAIRLLEQMIRLHIAAMHELCEYTRGEGFSEGFDAHLNIEQMNKTSVELFQLYDDHRKKGIDVPSEREFRGYYALLKLDKHPGYKVEPAELSLDLAKMTPDMRQSPEVLFARDVARACRAGNFIAFFRLARRGSYLQACLMHAHFSKLRTQALASLHSGLQINQGIPVAHVTKWLGMEEEDIENLLEYYGFSVKDFREPYMMKENSFINADNDFPVKHSTLVEKKRSSSIVRDVSSPPVAEFNSTVKVNELRPKQIPESKLSLPQLSTPVISTISNDEEMHDPGTVLSPKGDTQNTDNKASVPLQMLGVKINEREVHLGSPKPPVPDFSLTSSGSNLVMVESGQKPMHDKIFRNSFERSKPMHDPVFRNSFGRTTNNDLVITPPIALELPKEKSSTVLSLDSGVDCIIPQPMFVEDVDEHTTGVAEDDYKVTESFYDKEIAEAKLKLILRIWKRRSAKKREVRERKLLASNAALSSLSLGPPIWRSETQSGSWDTFNIDHIMAERHGIQERSLSLLNPSIIVAPKLVDNNPDAKCLCWKMILCSQEKTLPNYSGDPHNESQSAAYLWLHSKLIPVNNSKERDLLISSHDLAIWKHWIPSQSGSDPTCCLSVIKSTKFDDLTNGIIGTNAILFLLSEHIPLELQKKRLHDIISFLPSNSRLPLLILSDSDDESPAASTIANDLALVGIDKTLVTAFHIIFLKNHSTRNWDGFFSGEGLVEGLEWLATHSSNQTVVRGMKTRELVLSCLNSTTEILDGENNDRVDPNYCISAFNEVLDRSINEVAAAARSNPTGWPCPEIELLDKSGYEYKNAAWYFPSTGWSSPERIQAIMSALSGSKLPTFRDDLSWLLIRLNTREDIENKKLQLAKCLTNYLMEIGQVDETLVQNEVNIMLQRCTRLELHGRNFLIVPHWFAIFRRIYSWRLMNLTRTDISSVYVLAHQDPFLQNYEVVNNSEIKGSTLYVSRPSLDEMIEVSYIETVAMDTDYEAFGGVGIRTCYENVVMVEDEQTAAQNGTLAVTEVTDRAETANALKDSSSIGQADRRLSEMLKTCNMLQDLIDKKLSIYF